MSKESVRIQAEQERNYMVKICHELQIKCREMNSRSFRLAKGGKVIDLYTKSKKCFWHSDNEWGAVAEIESFLKFEFK
jgi:hypothetical protein